MTLIKNEEDEWARDSSPCPYNEKHLISANTLSSNISTELVLTFLKKQ